MMISIHQRMFRQLSVSHNKSLNHKKHTIAAKPSPESSAKALSLVDSGPPTQTFSHAQKHANKRLPFQTLVTIPTIAFTHFSWWRVLSSVIRSPWQKHQERKKDREHENKNKEMNRGKSDFSQSKFFVERAKQRNPKKMKKQLENTRGLKKDIQCLFFNAIFALW